MHFPFTLEHQVYSDQCFGSRHLHPGLRGLGKGTRWVGDIKSIRRLERCEGHEKEAWKEEGKVCRKGMKKGLVGERGW